MLLHVQEFRLRRLWKLRHFQISKDVVGLTLNRPYTHQKEKTPIIDLKLWSSSGSSSMSPLSPLLE